MERSSSKTYAVNALVGMCIVLVVFAGIGYNTLTLYAAPTIAEWGISRTQFMTCVTIVSLVNALGMMFAFGPLSDKLGIKRYLTASCALATAGFALEAFAPNFTVFLIGVILYSAGLPALTTASVNLVVDKWFKKNQTQMCSYAQTSSSIGGVVFAALWGLLIARLGWRIPLILTVAIGAAATIAITILYKGDPDDLGVAPLYAEEVSAAVVEDERGEEVDDSDGVDFARAIKSPQFYVQVATCFLIAVASIGVYPQLALFATDAGVPDLAGTVVSVALVAQAIGMLTLSPIADKFTVRYLVIVALAALVLGCVIVIVSGGRLSVVMLYVVAFLVGFSTAGAQMNMGPAVREAFGSKDFGKIVGITAACAEFGAAVGPMVVSLFYDMFGSYQSGLIAMIAVSALCCILIFPSTKRVKA